MPWVYSTPLPTGRKKKSQMTSGALLSEKQEFCFLRVESCCVFPEILSFFYFFSLAVLGLSVSVVFFPSFEVLLLIFLAGSFNNFFFFLVFKFNFIGIFVAAS